MSIILKYCVDSSLAPFICVNFHCFHCSICFPPSSTEMSWQLYWPHLLQHSIFHLFDDSHSNGCTMTYIYCEIGFAIFGPFLFLSLAIDPLSNVYFENLPSSHRSSLHPCLLSSLCRRFCVDVLLAHICFSVVHYCIYLFCVYPCACIHVYNNSHT